MENWALCAWSKVGKKLPRITYYLPPSVELAKISALSFSSLWPTSAAGKYHPGLSKEVDDLNLLLLLRSLEKEIENPTSANLESEVNLSPLALPCSYLEKNLFFSTICCNYFIAICIKKMLIMSF